MMTILRIATTWMAVLALSTSAFAGDLQKSIDKAVQQQATHLETAKTGPKTSTVLGVSLLVGGVAAAAFGFLSPKSFDEWQPSHVGVGVAGLGGIIAGGLVLLNGQDQASRSSSVKVGPHGVAVSKRVSW
jgi:hypothetical protein